MTETEKKYYIEVGKKVTQGVLYTIASDVLKAALFVIVVLFLFNWIIGIPTDDTDKDKWNRSGVTVITDHKTGVQYLYKGGALTPRLDKEGNIVVEN